MTLKEKIKADTISAMKAKDQNRLNALRNINTKILELEKAPGTKDVVDNDVIKIITKLIEQRNSVITEAEKIGRNDIIEKEKIERAVYEEFVPKSLTRDEILIEIKSIIELNSYSGMKDMKHVKSAFDEKYPGQEGKVVSEVAMSFLK